MFVSLERQTSRICEGREACPAAKWYWRPLNSKRSLSVLKWTPESEYFFFGRIYIYLVQEQSLDPSLRMRGTG